MDEVGLYDCPMPETFREKIDVTLFLALLYYLGFVSRVVFGPLMPEIEQDLGFSHAQAGHMFFVLSFGYMLAPICSGLFSSRLNHIGSLRLSAWLLGLALLPFAFVESIPGLTVLLLLVGFAGSLHVPSAIATITAEIQRSEWGKGLGVHQCAPPLSFVSGPLIAAWGLQVFSWRQILVGWGCLALLGALVYTWRGRGGEFPGRVVSPANISKVVRLPSFWIMVVLLGLAMAGNAGIVSMLPLFFVHERGYDLSLANTLLGCSQVTGLLVVFFAGVLADRFGPKRFIGVALTLSALLTITIGLADGWLLIAALFVQPVVLTAFFPAAIAALSRIAPPTLRSVTSALGPPLGFMLGAGVLPVAIGHFSTEFSLGWGIVGAGLLMLIGPLLVGFLSLGNYDSQPGC